MNNQNTVNAYSVPPTACLGLSGVKVLDLTRLLPGPHATFVLAGYGADVIKVEDIAAGDYARHSSALACSGFGAAFTATNAGKRSIAIDLKKTAGREVFLRLVQDADVVVESFRPGVMQRLGLDYATLSALNPALVFCAISGYGQSTPQAALAGHDLNYQGDAGLLAQRKAEHASAMPPALLGDMVGGGFSAVIAIMAALLELQRTGRGRFIDISMAHGALALQPLASVAVLNGVEEAPFGRSRLTGGSPAYGIYAASDQRYVTLGALEPKFWQAFCRHSGLNDLAHLEFDEDDSASELVHQRLQALFLTRTGAEWQTLGQQWDVCLGLVHTLDEALDAARSLPLFHVVGPADCAFQVVKGMTADLAQTALPLTAPPRQGEHTQAVLRAAGYSEEALGALLAQRVVV